MSVWSTKSLGELCQVAAGGTPSRSNSEYFGGSIPWVKIGDMEGSFVDKTEEYITEIAVQNGSTKVFPAGTILVSIFGTIGRTAVLNIDAATNQAIAGLTPKDTSVLNPSFLRLYLDSISRDLWSKAKGVAQLNINSTVLRSVGVPLPSMSEQMRIIGLLDQVESLRVKRREAIALLDELAQSIFLDMFGDLPSNPRAWDTVTLGDVIVGGPQNGLYKPQKFYGAGCRIARIDSFYSGKLIDHARLKRVLVDESDISRHALRDGDILINRVNSIEYLGKSALVERLTEPVVFESNMMRVSVDRSLVEPAFVVRALQSQHTYGQIVSAAKKAVNQASINQTDVKSLSLYLPPLDLQSEFARRSARIYAQKGQMLAHLAELDALFASLQDRAFRGELWAEESAPVA